jgi:hypothetical protein
LTANNHFLFGDALFTVGYTVNGVSDDWMYSKTASKNRIHSFTPEVGTTFWADASEIIPICQSTLMQNLSLASLVFPKYNLEDLSEDFFSEENLSFEFMLKNVGLTQKSSKINIKSLSPNFTVKTGESLTLDLKNAEEKKFIFSADFVKKPKNGDTVIFEISVENGVNSFKKQFTKYVGKTVTFLQDDCENAEKWNGTWGNSRSVFYAGRASLTDSPLTFYSSQKTNIFVLKTPVDLTRAQQAQLSFYAKWETELNFDGVFLEISADNSPWTALCMPSARLNAAGKPFYDGFQDVWRKEKIDLSEFAGKKISLRFKLQSDEGMQKDGFYFDNLLIKGIEKEGEVTLGENDDFNENNLLIYPNPSNGQFKISFHFSNFSTETNLEITDLTGKIIVKKSVENNLQELDIQLTAGFYLCKLSRNGKTICKKILVN